MCGGVLTVRIRVCVGIVDGVHISVKMITLVSWSVYGMGVGVRVWVFVCIMCLCVRNTVNNSSIMYT